MITAQDFAEECHLLIHSLRLVPNYKSSIAEQKLSALVIERFGDTCRECFDIREKNKLLPQQQAAGGKGILNKLGNILHGV